MLVQDTCLLFYHLMFVCFFQICIINKTIGYTHFGCLSKQVIYFQIIRQKQLVCLLIYVLDLYHHGYLQLLQRFCHSSPSWVPSYVNQFSYVTIATPFFQVDLAIELIEDLLGVIQVSSFVHFLIEHFLFLLSIFYLFGYGNQDRCQWALTHVQDGLAQEKNKNCKNKKL